MYKSNRSLSFDNMKFVTKWCLENKQYRYDLNGGFWFDNRSLKKLSWEEIYEIIIKIEHDGQSSEIDELQTNTPIEKNNISVKGVLEDLQWELDNCRKPMSYQEKDYYERCEAKADAYEDAINIVKKYIL